MVAKSFKKDEWKAALAGLRSAYRVVAPLQQQSKPFSLFEELGEGDEARVNFDVLKTRLSPKQVLFPQSERMFDYALDATDPQAHVLTETPKDYSPVAVVGIRPCDATAFSLVQINFNTPEFKDPWWTARRETTTLIGFGCNEPEASCFCTSVTFGPFGERDLDAMMYDLGDRFVVKSLSEKGEKALAGFAGGADAKPEDLAAAAELVEKAAAKIGEQTPTDKLAEQNAVALFEASFWQDVASGCINCGTCTFSCPTCWCFDIQDETFKNAAGVARGDRIRNWDSCMFELFTRHGLGHNPRGEKHQRVRQRFMHKLKYYIDKYDDGPLCVGCGRCIDSCPVNIDIRQVCTLMNNFIADEAGAEK